MKIPRLVLIAFSLAQVHAEDFATIWKGVCLGGSSEFESIELQLLESVPNALGGKTAIPAKIRKGSFDDFLNGEEGNRGEFREAKFVMYQKTGVATLESGYFSTIYFGISEDSLSMVGSGEKDDMRILLASKGTRADFFDAPIRWVSPKKNLLVDLWTSEVPNDVSRKKYNWLKGVKELFPDERWIYIRQAAPSLASDSFGRAFGKPFLEMPAWKIELLGDILRGSMWTNRRHKPGGVLESTHNLFNLEPENACYVLAVSEARKWMSSLSKRVAKMKPGTGAIESLQRIPDLVAAHEFAFHPSELGSYSSLIESKANEIADRSLILETEFMIERAKSNNDLVLVSEWRAESERTREYASEEAVVRSIELLERDTEVRLAEVLNSPKGKFAVKGNGLEALKSGAFLFDRLLAQLPAHTANPVFKTWFSRLKERRIQDITDSLPEMIRYVHTAQGPQQVAEVFAWLSVEGDRSHKGLHSLQKAIDERKQHFQSISDQKRHNSGAGEFFAALAVVAIGLYVADALTESNNESRNFRQSPATTEIPKPMDADCSSCILLLTNWQCIACKGIGRITILTTN